jgi:hypothetical protein
MSKLTLSIDDEVVSKAKLYAARQGVSVSRLVQSYLAAISERQSPGEETTPVLQALRGSLKAADTRAWKKHLIRKYR